MSKVVYNVKIDGVDQMLSNLMKIDESIRSNVALEAVQEGASIIQARGVMNAPVKTGQLRNSFKTESRKTATGAEAEVGPHTVYARIQELGGYTGRGHKTKITGKFYLSRAVEETRGQVSTAMAEAIQDYLLNRGPNGHL